MVGELRLVQNVDVRGDDEALVVGWRQGRPGAAAAVWRAHAPAARAVLRRTLGPRAELELDDLVQEVFMRVYGRLHTLREPRALRSFIIGFAVNVASKQLRRWAISRWLRLSDTGALPEPAAPTDDWEGREAVVRLYRLLERHSSRDRLIFTLRLVDGLELTEVAAAVGVSLATAKRRLLHVSTKVRAAAERDPVLAEHLDAVGGRT